ncbi:EAL and HDOD domain-containing protein [Psychromonas sp. KJ10-10]|uniref:EAL and HDOD domain-containing protein n=1 Tax=Psychromonas sp. KJ10-10 TaxID=3391823 RepID=UPI0039B4BCEA
MPKTFPKDKMVIEILGNCEPSEILFNQIKSLKHDGYIIALNNFVPAKKWERFFPFVDIIKLDTRLISIKECIPFINHFIENDIKFLAEKVETYDEYQDALEAGFDYFQGYFFSKPKVIKKKVIYSSIIALTRLADIISKDEIDFYAVEKIITSDVALSYKLLLLVNSSSNIIAKITSFRQAISYLGEKKLRQFVTFILISSVQEGKPEALYRLSIQRAHFCELIMKNDKQLRGKAFLIGIFSLLDSILDQPFDIILKKISFDEEVKSALLLKDGKLGKLLLLVMAYEKADWDVVQELSLYLGLTDISLGEFYQDSLTLTDELFI